MALRRFMTTLASGATGSSLIKTADNKRGVILKGLLAGAGLSLSAGSNDITISTDFTGATVGSSVTKRASAALTKNANTTYENIAGLSFTVVPGTYEFVLYLPSTVASGTAGIKYGFNYTTAVLSSLQSAARGFTASAVAVQNVTSTTAQADLFTQAAVVIMTEIVGTMVVTTGGTVDVQMAQNTSNASNTVALLGGSATFTRIA